jgi:hypothetical protein
MQAVFLAGAALTVLVVLRVVQLIYWQLRSYEDREAMWAGAPALALIGLLVGFYFLNWIPPVPLSLKFGGMYHEVKRSGDRFELSFEKSWYEVWKSSDSVLPADDPVYCFTAVFAPVALKTTIYHHWYYRLTPVNLSPLPTAFRSRFPVGVRGDIEPTPLRRGLIRGIGGSMWKPKTVA